MRSSVHSLAVFISFAAFLQAQHPPATPTEKPPVLLPGLGAYRFPIATRSEEAQKFFNQGFNMLYGFNRYEALRSFRRASELDSKALMPRVGMALAQGPHINMDLDMDTNMKEYCAVLDAARPLRAAAPKREQAWFDTAASRCPQDNPGAHTAAVKKLCAEYPDDLDAQTFYAESLMIPVRWHWFLAGGRPNTGTEEAIHTLEAVMLRNPDHPGANHFYIHAVESSPNPSRAIPSAQRLMGIVPEAGHIVHMPAHIWLVLGDFETAATTNERAAQVDRHYFEETGLYGHTYTGYFVHNLHFVAVARQMQGNWTKAIAAANEVAQAAQPMVEGSAMMVDAFIPLPLFTMLRFNRWDDILATPAPDSRLLATTAIWHFARAVAQHAKGKTAEAATEHKLFEQARSKVPADWIWGNNKAADILAVSNEALQARLAPTEAEAIPHWRRAAELQDEFVYDEPPPFYYPIRESLGGAYLRAGRAAEAEKVFREALAKSPKNGRVLFGLMESLKAQGKSESVALVRPEFEQAWKHADVTLRVADL